MGKIVDITDKLSFDENPLIRIKGEDLEIQASAENMLKIMGMFESGKTEIQAAMEATDLIFNERDKKKIKKLELQIKDYMKLIQIAINTAMDLEEGQGEQ